MCSEEDWGDKRFSEARRVRKAAVTDAVAIRMTRLLRGKLGETPLTAKELAETAKALIADMATPDVPEGQSSDEN